ncbi:hypothetical protein [Bacillus sp. 1P06AnD]|uniref:hypothetical protein n=1 Tax=Bacillus sp. 1P06AnD TaxID=3132208 RepID=UPI0039A0152D
MPKENSFFRTMIEEKGLMNDILEVEFEGLINLMEVPVLVSHLENAPAHEQVIIEKQLRNIDLINADMKEHLKFLFECYLNENCKTRFLK